MENNPNKHLHENEQNVEFHSNNTLHNDDKKVSLQSEKKEKTKKSKFSNIRLEYLFSLLLLCCSLFLFWSLYNIHFISWKWLRVLAILLLAINLICFLPIFLRGLKRWMILFHRCIVIFLCLLLGGSGIYAYFFSENLFSALEAISQPETASTVNVSIYVKKDSDIRKLEQLNDKKIGIQNGNDKANSTYVKEQLNQDSSLSNITFVEALDYDSLYEKLQKEEIDALIVTESYVSSLLKENFPTIEDDIYRVASFQKKRESSLSTSTKDIRYEPFTVYIAGVDEGDDPSIDARSDVNILLLVNPLANQIDMVSIPRDAFVPNPALGNANDKLTHLGLNGVENSMEGLEEVFNIEIDFYAKLNFFSVIEIVDALGGIEVDVPIDFCEQDENRSFDADKIICLNKGKQKVDGRQALAFARHRKSYTDVMRGKAQQEVIKGIINVLTTPTGATKINDILKIAPSCITTNMPMEQITNFVSMQLDNLKPWTINSIVLENGIDASLITASMPGVPLSVYLIHQQDAISVFDQYNSMLEQMQFSSFSFHLDHLEENKANFTTKQSIVWAGSNTSSYQPSTPEISVPVQEDLPSVTTPQPDVPTVEETPSPPVDNGNSGDSGNNESNSGNNNDNTENGNNGNNGDTDNGENNGDGNNNTQPPTPPATEQ